MRRVITKDGSLTFFNESHKQTYHSNTGALEESFEKFAIPALKDKIDWGIVRILDVCFGIGYNSVAAIHYCRKNNPDLRVEIVALENDEEIIGEIDGLEVPDLIKEDYAGILDKVDLRLGDARVTLRELGLFDVVFLDPFSDAQELWASDFIKELFSHLNKGGVLTTYSCAGRVRRNLKTAGFVVEDGPRVGRRSPSTIARKL